MGKAEPGNGAVCILSRQIIHVEAEGREMALKGPSHRWGPRLSLYSGAKKSSLISSANICERLLWVSCTDAGSTMGGVVGRNQIGYPPQGAYWPTRHYSHNNIG